MRMSLKSMASDRSTSYKKLKKDLLFEIDDFRKPLKDLSMIFQARNGKNGKQAI
jgi:hypothetical protein